MVKVKFTLDRRTDRQTDRVIPFRLRGYNDLPFLRSWYSDLESCFIIRYSIFHWAVIRKAKCAVQIMFLFY